MRSTDPDIRTRLPDDEDVEPDRATSPRRRTREEPEPPLRRGERVARLVALLTRAAGGSSKMARRHGRAARFYDIGMAAVSDELIAREDPLSPEEYQLVRLHPVFGERMLSKWDTDSAELARSIARSHHERWDGEGYPDRRAGFDIPGAARVTAVADALDAMIRGRPHSRPRSPEEALMEISRQAGHQFDPEIVEALEERPWAIMRTYFEAGA